MENVINPEFNNRDAESVPSVSVADGRGDQALTTTTCIFCEQDHAAVLQEIELATASEVSTDLSERDLGVIRHKRIELDDIQKDLDELMSRLNIFIDEVDDNSIIDDEVDTCPMEDTDNTEKQDGPSEKELKLNYLRSNHRDPANEYYTSEPSKPPEINWDAVGPILQKHVSDLQKIHALNQMTNAVVQRIKNVAHVDENILKIQSNEENCE